MLHVLDILLTRTFENSYPMDGEHRSVTGNAGRPVSSCLSPSALIGDSISLGAISSSMSIRLMSCGSATRVSVDPVTRESDGGGVGCWRISGDVSMASSWVSSISRLLQLDLSSSGGHEECEEGAATMLSSLEGVGMGVGLRPRRRG